MNPARSPGGLVSGGGGGGDCANAALGFAPIADERAAVLVLGSFPSQASLAAGHYYAHPRNQFWRLMSAVLGEDLAGASWEARYLGLRSHGIALWDVLLTCERPGSLDADIRRPSANDLGDLIARLPMLRRVVFNGGSAARYAPRLIDAGFEVVVLPSSSPAHAALSFEHKRERWTSGFAPKLPQSVRRPDRSREPDLTSKVTPSTSGAGGAATRRPPANQHRAAGQQRPAAHLRPATRHRSATPHRSVEVPITLSESGGVRFLHFGSEWIQGAMLMSHPNVLVLDYVQRMMAWLMFLSPPTRVLQLGLGAGALTRFIHARLPATQLSVVECSGDVIDVARACFAVPPNDDRLRVCCDDAGAFVARPRQAGRYGVVQVDLYDEHARGPVIDTEEFYRDCRRVIAEPGMCVVNLFGSHRSFAPNIARLRRAFGGRILVIPATPAGNRIVLAFAGPPLRVEWTTLERRAQWLERRFGWPVGNWYELLRAGSTSAACEV